MGKGPWCGLQGGFQEPKSFQGIFGWRKGCQLYGEFNSNQSPYIHKGGKGENTIKGAKGVKVKVLSQGLHMTYIVFVLVYHFKICISRTSFNTAFWI